ncbi:carboxymuconolactone decarboxylase family protein [Paenactinomyces guangxiensis]|uniref:Carboxymuconolactone decarboxylase family protein n=1 Tax=Paenactinomyces guangxiensis TaxID=1490290 RepID=A0A7W1WPF7_9BACL|nr:carboxymuconolactone decarboxylase family protein [Paenactinomyces guangxiensis]MBA4493590.1 carboxymuconolactone decarboxylase family protein [Paenactinomyces guangxiensis]MBH8590877.1 carboxymuconolactone decarboxylase family protein [Paenactinomyces guangxiensis]
MDGTMIQQALREYQRGVGHLAEQLPDVVREYNRFTDACFAEGELSKKIKHLIGLSLGVYTNDEYCIIFHTKGAVDHGASDREVLEAAAVCGAFGGGSAMSQAVTLVQEALTEFRGQTH